MDKIKAEISETAAEIAYSVKKRIYINIFLFIFVYGQSFLILLKIKFTKKGFWLSSKIQEKNLIKFSEQ